MRSIQEFGLPLLEVVARLGDRGAVEFVPYPDKSERATAKRLMERSPGLPLRLPWVSGVATQTATLTGLRNQARLGWKTKPLRGFGEVNSLDQATSLLEQAQS